MSSFISGTEAALQQVAETLAKFEKPILTQEVRQALWMTIGDIASLERLCEAVKEKSNGLVEMRPVSFHERAQFFSIEVFGSAAYFVLQTDNRIQSVILTSDRVIIDKK